ncbi:MAG: XRE family transcriptional regulator, partial [Clostridia bacterium]|nr:XRE family transcriptional regulator [Clostridia bacterium]
MITFYHRKYGGIRMSVGERIKTRRKRKQLTQSQLAEIVGVSTQAISKWETGGGMPDISQIVPLSQALGMSTDELLGNQNRRKEYELKWQKILQQYGEGSEELIEFVNEALLEFPNDETFLYRRMCDEYFLSQSKDNIQADRYLDLARCHALRLTEQFPDFDSVVDMLVSILVTSGMRDEAIEWAYKSKNKDCLLKCCLTEKELRRHRQKLIDEKLRDLIREMTWNDSASLNTAENIIKTVIPDQNYLYYNDSLMMIEKCRAEFYIHNNDYEKAVASVRNAFEIAKKDDGKKGEHRFTAPVFDSLFYKRNSDMPTLVWQLM